MYKTVSFIVFIFLCSCTKDIYIDLDKHESKTVVNSFFSPGGSLTVNISKSTSIMAADTLYYIDNADVKLFQGATLIGKLTCNQKGVYTIPVQLISEMDYNITVNVPGLPAVSSHDTIPALVPIISFDTISMDSAYLYCEIKFQDIAHISNYYLLEVVSKIPFLNKDSVPENQVDIIISDIIAENGRNGETRKLIFFSDEQIQGAEYNLSFLFDKELLFQSINDDSNTVFINFKTISKDFYVYLKTYFESQTRQMNVFTNIENGYGIFAGYNVSQDSIIIKR